MCLFTFPNKSAPKALVKGISRFECGGCPECMAKKSRQWALRCHMESLVSVGCMVTLTYDTYKYEFEAQSALDRQSLDKSDKKWLSKFEELPPDPTIPLSKRHCQLFIKRLRKHFKGKKIKYLLTAERGKRTNRAHYHALLFGVQFDDLIKYKKSDRGNWIYKSKTLEKIWKHGICTVDCINLTAATARYCTKYCAKDSGADDTFMLFSRGIGMEMLLKKFNGLSYWVDGREYSIPKQVWQRYIERKYGIEGYSKYVPKRKLFDIEKAIYNQCNISQSRELALNTEIIYRARKIIEHEKRRKKFRKTTTAAKFRYREHKLYYNLAKVIKRADSNKKIPDIYAHYVGMLAGREESHERGRLRNEFYAYCRDNDKLYKRYLEYWSRKSAVYERYRPSEYERILSLPVAKYRSYIVKAMHAKDMQINKEDFIPPRSNCHAFQRFREKKVYAEKSFALLSRHYRANDTIKAECKQQIAVLTAIRHSLIFRPAEIVTSSPF